MRYTLTAVVAFAQLVLTASALPSSTSSTLALATSAPEDASIKTSTPAHNSVDPDEDDVEPSAVSSHAASTFNGQTVPPLQELGGDQLAKQLKLGYTMVKFYSPQCPHCIHVAPTYQTLYEYYWTSKPLASSSAGNDEINDFHHYYKSFDFVAVNCLAFGDTCQKHEVNTYPTFKLFKDGEVVDEFTGAKDIDEISEFIEKNLEIIRPGSRAKGGPKLPNVKDKYAPDFDKAAFEKQKSIAATATAKPTTKPKKAAKPKPTPNLAGRSVQLTAESFQDLVTMTQEPWFVKFYAPWCQHCQHLAPIWSQVAKEMKGKLNIGEVNCDKEVRLCKDVKVRGYPTIHFFRGGERVEYKGLRGLGDFISYTNKAVEVGVGVPDVDLAAFKKLEETEEVIFVYFYDLATTTEDFTALERLTMSLIGHARIVKTEDPAMAARFKITTWPRLIVSRDGRPTYYTELEPGKMRDFRRVLNWMQSVWLPMVPELTASNSREVMDGRLVVLGILSRERPDEFQQAKKELKTAAMEWMDKQIQAFQLERQELRDAKQLRIEEAEDRNDQRALRSAKTIRIDMDRSDKKEVGFAWVDGIFWERWIRTTFGIKVSDGEKIIIFDEDNHRYWDTTQTGNYIIPSRTSILETIPKVVHSPPKIKPKFTASGLRRTYYELRAAVREHKIVSALLLVGGIAGALVLYSRRARGSRRGGGFFKVGGDHEGNGLLGGNAGAKVD